MTFTEDDEAALKKTVLEVIEFKLKDSYFEVDASLKEKFSKNGACFVTLYKNAALRGCIGTLEAHEPLIDNIIHNAEAAAFKDPRFSSMKESELNEVSVELSILTAPVAVASYTEITLGVDGIIFRHNGKRSVFLPEVPTQQNWDLETTLKQLARKAGLSESTWMDADYDVFQAIKIK
ncbi:MAG: AmmeMemoRadiSam system protein A [Lentisphaeria bacterium]|nr:AmmeMemoRadiSam system protein A [Lentisphaeria bacterium]NQZ67010.1 AmmeMemoRadiSam system protein A [Lentisphaeria bacterium]